MVAQGNLWSGEFIRLAIRGSGIVRQRDTRQINSLLRPLFCSLRPILEAAMLSESLCVPWNP